MAIRYDASVTSKFSLSSDWLECCVVWGVSYKWSIVIKFFLEEDDYPL